MAHVFTCEMDLALTYSLSRPRLARECALAALEAARVMQNPEKMYLASELLAIIVG